jgi:hypothetical protein
MKIRMNTNCNIKTLLAAGIIFGGLCVPVLATADDAPLSYVADPGVYKLLAENELFRVVLATWKPGQRDTYHSHSANAAYRLGDCKVRVYGPDGKVTREAEAKAGTVNLQAPIPSHSLQNISSHECQVLIVERK